MNSSSTQMSGLAQPGCAQHYVHIGTVPTPPEPPANRYRSGMQNGKAEKDARAVCSMSKT